jgi:peptidoglycan/LPS O-acetylase OafA/YrhL
LAPAGWLSSLILLIAATSVASYHLIERPLIRVGQRLAARITSRPGVVPDAAYAVNRSGG